MIRIGNVRVVDFHVHFHARLPGQGLPPQPSIIQAYGRERDARMAGEWDHGGKAEPPAHTAEEEDALIRRWVEEIEKYNLGRIVFVMGSTNANLSRVVSQYPQHFSGLVCLRNPFAPGAIEELRQGVTEWGLKGLKMLGPRVDGDWEDERLQPMWQFMAERGLPCLIHFGWLGKAGGVVHHRNMSPLSIAPIARRYPEINFVIPHFGCGYTGDLLQLMWAFPNIYVDTSGSNQWMRWLPYALDLDSAFRKFYETVGPKRIVFGTDSSWFPRGFSYRYLQDQVRACRYLNLPETDLADIFAGNALRLLGLSE